MFKVIVCEGKYCYVFIFKVKILLFNLILNINYWIKVSCFIV